MTADPILRARDAYRVQIEPYRRDLHVLRFCGCRPTKETDITDRGPGPIRRAGP